MNIKRLLCWFILTMIIWYTGFYCMTNPMGVMIKAYPLLPFAGGVVTMVMMGPLVIRR